MESSKYLLLFILTIANIMGFENCSYAQLMPFPWCDSIKYDGSTIKPTMEKSMMNKIVGELYDDWQQRYIKNVNDSVSYVLFDVKGRESCVAEGQGYGMVIVALMAGHDAAAKRTYDRLFTYYESHRCTKRGSHLMMASQNKNGKNTDQTSATDGDLDIAYSLLLADKQWGSKRINYFAAAKYMIKDIMDYEINHITWTLLLSNGDEIDSKKNEYFATRPSDFMPSYFRVFRLVSEDSNWDKVIKSEYNLLKNMQRVYSNKPGFIPDCIIDVNTSPKPAPHRYLKGEGQTYSENYSYNACRIPWRLATDYIQIGDTNAYQILTKINEWVKKSSAGDSKKIYDGYNLSDGTPISTKDKLHLCFVAPLATSAMIDKKNKDWLNTCWNYLISVKMKDYENDNNFGYYDNSIRLLNMIILSGNYWKVEY